MGGSSAQSAALGLRQLHGDAIGDCTAANLKKVLVEAGVPFPTNALKSTLVKIASKHANVTVRALGI